MEDLASWTGEMGWHQTEKADSRNPHSKDEFVGLKEGYWCVITKQRGTITLHVHLSSEDQKRFGEIARAVHREDRLLGRPVVSANPKRLTLTFYAIAMYLRNRTEQLQETLEAIIPLLENMGLTPSGSCECGNKSQLECHKYSESVVHARCAQCAAKAKASS